MDKPNCERAADTGHQRRADSPSVARDERGRSINVSTTIKTSLLPPLTLRAGGRETGGKKGPCVYELSLATQTQLAKVCSPNRAPLPINTRLLKGVQTLS